MCIRDRDKRVHMAHIDIHYGYSVNGVAAIHTEILKQSELNHFYKIYPEKFNKSKPPCLRKAACPAFFYRSFSSKTFLIQSVP